MPSTVDFLSFGRIPLYVSSDVFHRERSAGDEASEHLPAIDGDVLAGDPAGERRTQEQSDLGYLLRAAQSAERDASEDAAVEVGIVQSGALPGAAGKLDRTGCYAVDADPFAGESSGLGQSVFDDRRLDCCVRRGAGRGAEPRDRRDVEDRAGAGFFEVRQCRADRAD